MKLEKGKIYRRSAVELAEALPDGYHLDDYFDADGRYLGPDADGVEPEVMLRNPTMEELPSA